MIEPESPNLPIKEEKNEVNRNESMQNLIAASVRDNSSNSSIMNTLENPLDTECILEINQIEATKTLILMIDNDKTNLTMVAKHLEDLG